MVTIQMKAYRAVFLSDTFTKLAKMVVITLESVDETIVCDY